MEEYPYCPQPVGWMDTSSGIHPVACKRWDCPHCGKIRRWRLINRVRDGFANSDRIIAVTLTQRLGTSQDIVENFYKLRDLLRKRGIKLKYFWVKEFTRRGERHLHILIDTPILQSELKEMWKTVTKGESWVVWINEADIQSAGGYTTKYLTKSFTIEKYEKYERRYAFSKDDAFKEKNQLNKEALPILGDFWSIIGSSRNKARDGIFVLEIQDGRKPSIRTGHKVRPRTCTKNQRN